MSERHALLLGATGLVGGHVLRLVLDDSRWTRVTVLARREGGVTHAKLDWRVVHFDDERTWRDDVRVTDLFDCMGTTIKQAGSRAAFRRADLDIPLAVARAAHAQGATHLSVVSSLGADPRSRVFYSRVKGELEESVRGIGFASVHLLRPSLLLGARSQPRAGERVGEVALDLLSPLLVGGLRKYRAIRGEDVARALLALAVAPTTGVRVFLSDELARAAATA
jgi:uncharacterized protein YbjT (DUF2867 family)